MKIQECQLCGRRVVPRANGSCPSCNAEIAEPREVEAPTPDVVAVSIPAQKEVAKPSPPDEQQSTEDDEAIDFFKNAVDLEENQGIRISADPFTHTKRTIKRTLEGLQWAAIAAWLVIPFGGRMGIGLMGAVILSLDGSLMQTLSRTKAYNASERLKLKRKAIFWTTFAGIPATIWFAGYAFREDGFEGFSILERWLLGN